MAQVRGVAFRARPIPTDEHDLLSDAGHEEGVGRGCADRAGPDDRDAMLFLLPDQRIRGHQRIREAGPEWRPTNRARRVLSGKAGPQR
jgi:hypothetical protein